jgi:exosortase A
MKPDPALHLSLPAGALIEHPIATTWKLSLILIAGLLIWLFAWHAETALSTIAIWYRSETYAHGYLIFPISAYLIWNKRHKILEIRPEPSALGILALVSCGMLWLISDSAETLVVSQYALVAMVPALVWTLLGYRVCLAMLFPLLFLLFAVPVGDFLLAPMMNFTADFTVTALRLTGIPVFREGNFFTVPSGNWSVVEACSGLRYLIASLTLGCLFSYLTYRSQWRRVAFIALSIIAPVVANGLRAYMIVMIGHLSNNRLATGIDHVIYGWVFFGLVMMLLFWFGSKWREPDEPTGSNAGVAPQTALSANKNQSARRIVIFACLSALSIAIWPSYARHLDESQPSITPLSLAAPRPPAGWLAHSIRVTDWQPHYLTSMGSVIQTYERQEAKVEVLVKYYRNQRQGAELINTNNQLVSTKDPVWGLTSDDSTEFEVPGGTLKVNEATLRSAHGKLLVWNWYWIDGKYTSNAYLAKLYQAKAKILGQGDDSAAIFVYVAFDEKRDSANEILRKFMPEIFSSIDQILSAAKH